MNTSRLKLAVVEDDEDVRAALNRLLRSLGHEVHLFESAEAFDDRQPDVDCVILDVRLPGLSGVELSERLRQRGSRLPVVFITGDSDSPCRESRRDDQLNAPAITKPFSDEELMGAVARAISSCDRSHVSHRNEP